MRSFRFSLEQVIQLVRFYQAAIVNTVFGFGVYSFFVFIGIPMLVAQAVSHVFGVAFNYVTYSRYVFRDQKGSIPKFIFSYVAGGLLNFFLLFLLGRYLTSPYVAGLSSMILTSLVLYFLLSRLVFISEPTGR